MKIFFRYDDFSEISNADTDIAVLDALVSEGFKPLVGVIPAIADVNWPLGSVIPLKRLSQERGRLLRRYSPGEIDVALHGYTHQAVTRFSGLFEFGDVVPLDRQAERIRDGKQCLEDLFGAEVSWFIPPWNAYGATTLRALDRSGIRGVSAGLSGPVAECMTFAPFTSLPGSIDVACACCGSDGDSSIIVMLHDYDFKEADSISKFRQKLLTIRRSGFEGGGFSEILGALDWGATRALRNQELRKTAVGPLRFLMHSGIPSVYWSEQAADRLASTLRRRSRQLDKMVRVYKTMRSLGRR